MRLRSRQVTEPIDLCEWTEIQLHCAQQKDGHSCGLHVMLVYYFSK
jgi:hypothetical protein